MNCPECNKKMSDQEVIEHLKRKIARLEEELAVEKANLKWHPVPYAVLYQPYRHWWEGPICTGTPMPLPAYETTCKSDI